MTTRARSTICDGLTSTPLLFIGSLSGLLHESVHYSVQVNAFALIQHGCQHTLNLAPFKAHLADIIDNLLCGHLGYPFTLRWRCTLQRC